VRPVLLVLIAGLSEMDVAVDHAWKDVEAGGVVLLVRLDAQSAGLGDLDEAPVRGGQVGRERRLAGDDGAAPHDQIDPAVHPLSSFVPSTNQLHRSRTARARSP